jgi:hypothetical protein
MMSTKITRRELLAGAVTLSSTSMLRRPRRFRVDSRRRTMRILEFNPAIL